MDEDKTRHNPPCIHSMTRFDCLSCLERALWQLSEAYEELEAQYEDPENIDLCKNPECIFSYVEHGHRWVPGRWEPFVIYPKYMEGS